MQVDASTYAVVTHSMWSTPPSSPTMVGRAVDTIVWSSELTNMASMSPANTAMSERLLMISPCSGTAPACGGRPVPSARFVTPRCPRTSSPICILFSSLVNYLTIVYYF